MQRSVMYVDLVKGRNASVNVGMHEGVGKLLGEIAEQMKYKFCNLGEVEDKFGNMTNVLVICATKYSSEVQQSFLHRASTRYTVPTTIGCPHITEVLLLDLTTERMRQEFMGLENEPGLTRAMERMVVAACLATSSNE